MTSPGPSQPAPEQSAREPRSRARAALGRIGFWAPVWIACVVLAQVALFGLGPALAENRRLDRAERELAGRAERAERERAELELWMRAQSDPIYLERERRALATDSKPRD